MVCHEGDGPCVTVELCECTFQSWQGEERERGKYKKHEIEDKEKTEAKKKIIKLKFGKLNGRKYCGHYIMNILRNDPGTEKINAFTFF